MHKMASNAIYHKYAESDMNEIRQVRNLALMTFKMREKTKRLDVITKAILPDIKWDRIAPNIDWGDLEDFEPEVVELNSAVAAFREEMARKLEVIIHKKANYAMELIHGGYEPRICEAAITMANKYHARTKKPRKQRPSKPRRHTATDKTPTSPPKDRQTTNCRTPSPKPEDKPNTGSTTPKMNISTVQNNPPPRQTATTQTSPPRTKATCTSPPKSAIQTNRTLGTTPLVSFNRLQSTTGNDKSTELTAYQPPKVTVNRQPTIKNSFKAKKTTKKSKKLF